jgi:hypothetical protein
MTFLLSLRIHILKQPLQKLPLLFDSSRKGMNLSAQLSLILRQLAIRKIAAGVHPACSVKRRIRICRRVAVRVLQSLALKEQQIRIIWG